jgi:hypothetical protein
MIEVRPAGYIDGTYHIGRYSSEIEIDILEKLNKGIQEPKVQPGTMLTPFLDCAIGELYKCKKDFILYNKKDIINNLQGDSINFFGAIAELCVGGLLAPLITEHSSPDFMLSINKQTVSVEVTNRISNRGEITSDKWHKEHRSTIDKINNKKVKQNPDFLFVSFLERASQRVSKPMIMNVPIGWQWKVISTPEVGIRGELDNKLQGIFCYDFTPLYISSGESIVGTPLAYDFVDILKERFIKMFSIAKAKNVLFALDKIKDRSMSLNYSKDDQKGPN